MRQKHIDGILVTKPTREDVQSLKVGDLAPDCFGNMNPVVRIYAAGFTPQGKAYVLYYTDTGSGGSISGSLVEDEILSTVPVTAKWKRSDCVPW